MGNLKELNNKGVNGVAFEPKALSVELSAYGELEAAEKMASITSDIHANICELALSKMISKSLTTDKAICLAAVEIFEGSQRELKRKRRVYSKK